VPCNTHSPAFGRQLPSIAPLASHRKALRHPAQISTPFDGGLRLSSSPSSDGILGGIYSSDSPPDRAPYRPPSRIGTPGTLVRGQRSLYLERIRRCVKPGSPPTIVPFHAFSHVPPFLPERSPCTGVLHVAANDVGAVAERGLNRGRSHSSGCFLAISSTLNKTPAAPRVPAGLDLDHPAFRSLITAPTLPPPPLARLSRGLGPVVAGLCTP
jgi:hypothetical protein